MRPPAWGHVAHAALRRAAKRLARLAAVGGRRLRTFSTRVRTGTGRVAGALTRNAARMADRALAPLRNRYLPERYYMRGPGPASQRVKARQAHAEGVPERIES